MIMMQIKMPYYYETPCYSSCRILYELNQTFIASVTKVPAVA